MFTQTVRLQKKGLGPAPSGLWGFPHSPTPAPASSSLAEAAEGAVRANALSDRVNAAIHAAGLNPNKPKTNRTPRGTINLNTMFALASGALTLTLECSVSFDKPIKPPKVTPTRTYTFDELMEPVFVALREYLADGLERPFLVRGDERVFGD